jgi:hypothetical protein
MRVAELLTADPLTCGRAVASQLLTSSNGCLMMSMVLASVPKVNP